MSATLLARTRQGLPRSALLLTLLRLAPMRAGALLLSQLVLFLPVITGAFGWLSRRLDHGGDSAPLLRSIWRTECCSHASPAAP